MEHLNRNKATLPPKPIGSSAERDDVIVDVAMQWNDGYAENIHCYANNINTHDGGTTSPASAGALTRTLNTYALSSGLVKEGATGFDGDDTREGLCAVVSVKVPNPQFEGQTKGKLGNSEVAGHRAEPGQREPAAVPGGEPHPGQEDRRQDPRRRPCPGGRAQGAGPDPTQGSPRRRGPSRQARRVPGAGPGEDRALPRRGRLGRRLRQAGSRPHGPGGAAAAGQDPQRREGPAGQDPRLRGDPQHHHRPRHRGRGRRLRRRQAPLPPDHHHVRRRRRRQPHPHAAAHLLLPPDEGADRARPPLHRPAAAVQAQARQVPDLPQGRGVPRPATSSSARPTTARSASPRGRSSRDPGSPTWWARWSRWASSSSGSPSAACPGR